MVHRRRPTELLAVALAIAAMVPSPAISAAKPESGAALFRAAMDADNHISYTGTVTSVQYDQKTAASTVVRIDHNRPTSWRIWYVAPADAYGRLILSDETKTYQYEPKAGRVYSNPWSESAPPVTNEVNVARVLKNYSVELGPGTTAAGRPARQLSLISRFSGNLVERYWIDAQTKLPLRRERYRPDGTLAFKSSFDNVRFVNDLPKALFNLTVPSGMSLVPGAPYARATSDLAALANSAGFKLIDPTQLPDGFEFLKGSDQSHNGVQTIQLIYSDGLRSFSLFENASNRLPTFEFSPKPIPVGQLSGLFSFVSGIPIVSWLQNGLNITLVGDLAPRELARIGASLRP